MEETLQSMASGPSLSKPNQFVLRRQLNAIKREAFPWMLEVTKCAPQMAIIHLGEAFKNFFSGRARYPQYRKKGVHDSFILTNDQFTIETVYAFVFLKLVGYVCVSVYVLKGKLCQQRSLVLLTAGL